MNSVVAVIGHYGEGVIVRRVFTTSAIAIFISLINGAFSAPLAQAKLTRVYREVSMVDPAKGKRSAAVHELVKAEVAVETGRDSRAELLFSDNTLTRLAANTSFRFKDGTREMDLSRGAMLLQIPKKVGGAKVNTGAITAAASSTTGFVERVGDIFKLVVLEGTVRVYYRDRVRESMLVEGGQMLIASMKSKSMKDWSTVEFDVAKITKTSALLDAKSFAPLPEPAQKFIAKVIEKQSRAVSKGELNPTNMVIAGGVSAVTLVNSTQNPAESANSDRSKSQVSSAGDSTPQPSPTVTPTSTAMPTSPDSSD